jgi:CHAT domain-containing protein
MEELSFRINWIIISICGSLLVLKFLLFPLIERYIEEEHSDEALFQFRFWSTLLSWVPVILLWLYVFGQRFSFSLGGLIWCLIGIGGASLLGFFNSSSPEQKVTKGFIPQSNLLYVLSAQLCIFITFYLSLRFLGVIPYIYGSVYLIFLAVMLIFLLSPAEISIKVEEKSEEKALHRKFVSSSHIEKAIFSAATSMGVASSPLGRYPSSGMPYWVSRGGGYSSSEMEDLGCLIVPVLFVLGLVGLLLLISINVIFLVPYILFQTLIIIGIILIALLSIFRPIDILIGKFGSYLKGAISLAFILFLPNLLAEENIFAIAEWFGVPMLFGLPLFIVWGIVSKSKSKGLFKIAGILWGFLIAITLLIFIGGISNFWLVLSVAMAFLIILFLVVAKNKLGIGILLISLIFLVLTAIEGTQRLKVKRYLRRTESELSRGDYMEATKELQKTKNLIDSYKKFVPGFLEIVPWFQELKYNFQIVKITIATGEYSRGIEILEVFEKDKFFVSKATKIQTTLLKAELFDILTDYTKRDEMVKNALKIAYRTFNRPYWTAHVNRYRARIEMDKGNYDGAIKIFKNVEKVGKRIGSYRLFISGIGGMGDVYYKQGKYPDAEKFYAEALRLSRKFKAKGDEAQYLLKLAMAQKEIGKTEVASNNLSQAITLAREISAHETLWQGLYQMGLLLEGQGKKEEAFKNYADAINVIETIRGSLAKEEQRLGYVAGKMPVYEKIVSLLYQMGRENETFSYIQKAKSRTLLDLLGTRMVAYRDEDRKLAEREHLLQVKINALMERVSEEESKPKRLQSRKLKEWKKELQKAIEEHNDVLEEIKHTNPRLASLTTAPTVNISDVQNALHPDELFLEYFVTDEKILLYAITREEFEIFEILLNRKELNELVFQIYGSVSSGTAPGISLLNRAYLRILEPAIRQFGNKSHIIIAPHDKLFLLPFETLVTSTAAQTFVVDRYILSYYPSGSILVLNRKYQERKPFPQKPLFAVGDPIFDHNDDRYPKASFQMAIRERGALFRRVMMDETIKPDKETSEVIFPRLKATAEEVKRISSILGVSEESGDVKIGLEASEREVKRADHAKYRYEHYATHGVLKGDVPGLKEPALIFSLPNPDDPQTDEGFLTMSEIFGLRMNADMVVLSACKTALGEEVPGEGLIGLTRAFMYAGTPSVVASLWSVADESTAQLMTSYYKYLKQGMDKAEALTLAKRKLREEGYYNPFFWSPFILVGER